MKPEEENVLERYLKFEDISDQILEYKFQSGEMMWPYIRSYLLNYAVVKDSKLDSDAIKEIRGDYLNGINIKTILKYVFYILIETLKPLKKCEYIFLNSTRIGKEKIGKKIVNQEYDPYITIFDDISLNLETSDRFRINRPRYCKNVLLYDRILIKSVIVGKMSRISKPDKASVEDLINFLKLDFPCEVENSVYNTIRNELVRKSKTIKTVSNYWEKLLKRTGAKFVFVESGSYGNPHIFRVMRKYHVTTCEFQHGLIDRKHIEYNLSNRLINDNDYREGLPEFILTFGDYWNEQMRTCSKAVTIGNPKIANYYQIVRSKSPKSRKSITFFSNYLVSEEIDAIIIELIEKYRLNEKYDILIKRHPKESIAKNEDALSKNNVTFIKNLDAINVLAETDIVVSPESTVIYEATAFCENIFIYNNGSINIMAPKEVGETFSNAEELYDLIAKSRSRGQEINNNDYFFNVNWKDNYLKFIQDHSNLR